MADSQDLFDPLTGRWTRVSPALATVRRLTETLPLALGAVVALVVAVLVPGLRWIPLVVGALVAAAAAWHFVWARRNQRSWGYAEADDDLLVTSGVWFRRLVAVPYGRMQFVDVHAGPVQRWFGIASVTLHTASPETAATIPGLPTAEATRLRNRLTELGETRSAGV